MRRVRRGAGQGELMRRAGGMARRVAGLASRARAGRDLAPWVGSALAVPLAAALMMTPTAHGAVRLAARLAAAVATLSRHAPRAPETAASAWLVRQVPAVGALFQVTPAGLGTHFCTASVVDSPHRDLVITAAHCVTGKSPGQIAFVPGYHDGIDPYGVWFASKVVVDAQWQRSHSPDHDVAFLVIQRQDGSVGVQAVAGGERLGIGWPAQVPVHVVGYPDVGQRPVVCASRTRAFGQQQMRFDCGGYTNGTSGGPFLARWDSATRQGTVIGVIGGYEQGGDLASVSYSPRFGGVVRELYQTAVADG
jgi:V8-like Glu-specific endopeptidase